MPKRSNKIGIEADNILKKDIDLNNTGADKAAQDAADSYASAFMILAAILGAVVIIGVGVSFYVVRDVSTGIASIVNPMQALGKGDLSADVPHRGEKTEIGAMADTLQVFKEALIAKKAADEAAAVDAEAKIERGRRVDSITRNFESMIGEIVQTVSSASTQLEASAGTLSSTAARSQELTTLVKSDAGLARRRPGGLLGSHRHRRRRFLRTGGGRRSSVPAEASTAVEADDTVWTISPIIEFEIAGDAARPGARLVLPLRHRPRHPAVGRLLRDQRFLLQGIRHGASVFSAPIGASALRSPLPSAAAVG